MFSSFLYIFYFIFDVLFNCSVFIKLCKKWMCGFFKIKQGSNVYLMGLWRIFSPRSGWWDSKQSILQPWSSNQEVQRCVFFTHRQFFYVFNIIGFFFIKTLPLLYFKWSWFLSCLSSDFTMKVLKTLSYLINLGWCSNPKCFPALDKTVDEHRWVVPPPCHPCKK